MSNSNGHNGPDKSDTPAPFVGRPLPTPSALKKKFLDKGVKVPMSQPGRVQVIHGRETIARCQKCGSESWHVIGEVRREEKDNPLEVKCQPMRMVCTRCHSWLYIYDLMQPKTPRFISTRKHFDFGASKRLT